MSYAAWCLALYWFAFWRALAAYELLLAVLGL
jgi:hypothetical protein